MKLFFDQNLSPRLIDILSDVYPGSTHTQTAGLARASDEEVWHYAKQNGCLICSKDVDFHERSLLLGYPPKVIWINLGNCSTAQIAEVLRSHLPEIEAFLKDDEFASLVLSHA